MFKSLRVNSPIYILTKGYNPTLETGMVIAQPSQPRPSQSQIQMNPYQTTQQLVVDIVVQVGNDRQTLQGLPADQSIFDYKGNMVITEDKNLILNEIRNLYQQEEAKVNGFEHSKELMGIYSNMLDTLDPQEADRKKNANKIQQLEDTLAQQAKINEQILAQLQAMTQQNQELANQLATTKTYPKKNKE